MKIEAFNFLLTKFLILQIISVLKLSLKLYFYDFVMLTCHQFYTKFQVNIFCSSFVESSMKQLFTFRKYSSQFTTIPDICLLNIVNQNRVNFLRASLFAYFYIFCNIHTLAASRSRFQSMEFFYARRLRLCIHILDFVSLRVDPMYTRKELRKYCTKHASRPSINSSSH